MSKSRAYRRADCLYTRQGIECTVVRPSDETHTTCRVFVPLWNKEVEMHYSDFEHSGTLARLYYGLTRIDQEKSFAKIRDNGVKLPEPETTTRGWLSEPLGSSSRKLHGSRRR